MSRNARPLPRDRCTGLGTYADLVSIPSYPNGSRPVSIQGSRRVAGAGWPEIAAGNDILISAPTGSGKTLAASLICVDRLVRTARTGTLENETEVVCVSPLKALSKDVHRNLEVPLAEIAALAGLHGIPLTPIRTAVRTGDTPVWESE